jgi:hypothetical protein
MENVFILVDAESDYFSNGTTLFIAIYLFGKYVVAGHTDKG